MLLVPSNMKIEEVKVKVRDLVADYIDESEQDIENGVYAYGGRLCVRPAFQRSFVYGPKEQQMVIDTVLKGFPLGLMYWVDNGDGTYDCLDGQQRTLSICRFVQNFFKLNPTWHDKGFNFKTLKRLDPDLAERFLNYELTIKICKGSKAERMEWFKTINIAGKQLTTQELRNVNYVSPWLTDAKRYFSKANNSKTAACPAERVGGQYTNKDANRQEILEQVISWHANSVEDEAICEYMENHIYDKDASELWNYYNEVVAWVQELFVEYDKGMKTVQWGLLYNKYKDVEFDIDELNETFIKLVAAKDAKELDVSMAKICEYCITREENLLKTRKFTDVQRTLLYNKQNGICPDCGERFLKAEMDAHHIIPWYNGGTTDLENGVMLCKECHKQRHL